MLRNLQHWLELSGADGSGGRDESRVGDRQVEILVGERSGDNIPRGEMWSGMDTS